LYPNEEDFDEDQPIDYVLGFGRLFHPTDQFAAASRSRSFTFSSRSEYKTLKKDDKQYQSIEGYEKTFGIPVYYLLYNPRQIPSSATIPLVAIHSKPLGPLNVGCRVVPSLDLRKSIDLKTSGSSPAFSDLLSLESPFNIQNDQGGWRIETFVVELVLACKAGYRAKTENDLALHAVFGRRDAPIAAAIGITIDAPNDAELSIE
jgi:hypothetical protein